MVYLVSWSKRIAQTKFQVLANIRDFAKAVRHGWVFRKAAAAETWNQTGFDRRHHQRSGEVSAVDRQDSRWRNIFRPVEAGFEFCPSLHQPPERLAKEDVDLARENIG
jgi:hypothetical protein